MIGKDMTSSSPLQPLPLHPPFPKRREKDSTVMRVGGSLLLGLHLQESCLRLQMLTLVVQTEAEYSPYRLNIAQVTALASHQLSSVEGSQHISCSCSGLGWHAGQQGLAGIEGNLKFSFLPLVQAQVDRKTLCGIISPDFKTRLQT